MEKIKTSQYLLDAACRLHRYLLKEHWNGQALAGPDPGIRFNARLGRFVKSYLRFLPWSDNLIYMQAQGYWIYDNWLMADLLHDARYRNIARDCAEYIIGAQHPDGFWEYPNPEWSGRIATVEGCFAALGLLESYSRLQYEPFLAGAKQWYHYLVNGIGFRKQKHDGMLAINYFAHDSGDGGGVPNNTTLVLWTLAKLSALTNNERFMAPTPGLLAWLRHVQLKNGELPYELGSTPSKDRLHFLCFQYNAYELMDLIQYFLITADKSIWPILERLAIFLSAGLTNEFVGRYDCFQRTPEVIYYTISIAQALSQATALGLGDFHPIVYQAYRRVVSQQKDDGSFKFHSCRNYGFLSDRRSYPRYLSMILHHLLQEYQTQTV